MKTVALIMAYNDQGELLLGRRLDSGKWTLPGGHAEEAESPAAAAARELHEETGLKARALTLFHVLELKDLRLYVYSATVSGTPHGEFDPDHECEEWKFVPTEGGLPSSVFNKLHGPEDAKLNVVKQIFDMKKAESLTKAEKPVPVHGMKYGHKQLIAMGADGYLPHAVFMHIPCSMVDGREPTPSMEEGYKGRPITQPIEVEYDRDNNNFTLYAGNHRITQAEMNGDQTIPAFVHDPAGRYGELTKRFGSSMKKAMPEVAQEPEPETKAPKDLIVHHNLSEGNLQFAHKQQRGKLVAPSIAVSNKATPLTGYGDISLIAHPELINPQHTPVFDADVYSPRQPKAKPKLNAKKFQGLSDWLAPYSAKMGHSSFPAELDRETQDHGEDVLHQHHLLSPVAKLAFLEEQKGIKIKPPMKRPPLRWDCGGSPALVEFAKKHKKISDADLEYGSSLHKELSEATKLAIRQHADAVAAALPEDSTVGDDLYKRGMDALIGDDDGLVDTGRMRSVLADARSAAGQTKIVNTYDFEDKVKEATKPFEQEFREWAKQKVRPVLGDLYFPKGSRNIAYTPENVLKEVTRTIRGGENFNYGPGTARAFGAAQIGDFDELKNRAYKIVPHEEFEAKKKALDDAFVSLADKVAKLPGESDNWGLSERLYEAIGKSYLRGHSLSTELRKQGFSLPPHLVAEVRKVATTLYNMPTEYFEAKPQRLVGLNEFHAAVVPKTISPETLEILKSHGINHIETYDKGDEKSRAAAMHNAARGQGLMLSEATFDEEPLKKDEGNGNLDEVMKLLQHPNPVERVMALKLGTVTPAHLHVAMSDADPMVYQYAIGHEAVQGPELEALLALSHTPDGRIPWDQQTYALETRSSDVRPEYLDLLYQCAQAEGPEHVDRVSSYLARCRLTPGYLLAELFMLAEDPEKIAILGHPNASADLVNGVVKAILDSAVPSELAIAALSNPKIDGDALEAVVKQAYAAKTPEYSQIASNALKHPNCSPATIERVVSQAPLHNELWHDLLEDGCKFSPSITSGQMKVLFQRRKDRIAHASSPLPALQKSVNPDDFKTILKATHPDAVAMADHTKQLDSHPQGFGHEIEAYRNQVTGGSARVKPNRGNVGGVSKKKIYQAVVDGKPTKFMLKPYYEKVTPKLTPYSPRPHLGWAEMASQALYHAGGIGDLHQRVHVQEHDLGGRKEPMLVIHMDDDVAPLAQHHYVNSEISPELKEQGRKITLMDFLMNNVDRHDENLLYHTNKNRLLAIDHGRAFQYERNMRSKGLTKTQLKEVPDNDKIGDYTLYGATHHLGIDAMRMRDPKAIDNEREAWGKTFDWWGENSEKIKQAFFKEIRAIKDPKVRLHIARNFMARAKHLDDMANVGVDNFGYQEFNQSLVPLHKFKEPVSPEEDEDLERFGLAKTIDENDLSDVTYGNKYSVVNHVRQLGAHPPAIQADVDHFNQHVLNTPEKSRVDLSSPDSGYMPKVVVHGGGKRYLIKPFAIYSAKHCGWSEMASQALYHAAGLGHLHQKVHIAEVGDKDSPSLVAVVHMDEGVKRICDAPGFSHLDEREMGKNRCGLSPQVREDMGMIHMMDVLTHNADRHSGNLMVSRQGDDPVDRVLAIDHGDAFQYDRGAFSHEMALGHVMSDPEDRPVWLVPSELGGANSKRSPFTRAALRHWEKVGPAVRQEMAKQAAMLPEPRRRDVLRGFNIRAGILDLELRRLNGLDSEVKEIAS